MQAHIDLENSRLRRQTGFKFLLRLTTSKANIKDKQNLDTKSLE